MSRQRFVWARAIAIARKEVFHILRDPFTLSLALILPVFMVVVYGVAIDFNIQNIRMAVHDSDKTQASRRLIDTFTSSHYFRLHPAYSPEQAYQSITSERARAALIIPAGFEKELRAGRIGEAQVLVDGSDNSSVGPVVSYVGSIQTIASKRIADFDPPRPFEIRTRFLFNPELDSRWFVIPGLAVVVMSILSILLTALTVSREWENGSMELLLSTPVQPVEIIVGKLLPYAVLGMIAVSFVYFIARVAFGVPFEGNLGVFALGCGLFLATYLAQGLLISVISRNQQIAMQLSMVSGLLPSNLLSGFVFPIESMPIFFQYFTMILPARWFMRISRDTFLMGSSLVELRASFLALALLCALMILLATRRFKRDLEP